MFSRVPGKVWEVALVAGVFLWVNLFGAVFQHPITYNEGKGWEGVDYHALAGQFARGEQPRAEAPMVYRVGTPWLAARASSLFGGDLFAGFRAVNLVANLLSTGLLVVWLRRHLRDWRVRSLLAGLFLGQWDAPVRFLHFSPVHTDPWLWVFLLGGLLAADRARTQPGWRPVAALATLSFVGVFFREVAAVVPLAFLFADNPVQRTLSPGPARWRVATPRGRRFLPLAASAGAFVLVRCLVIAEGGYSFGRSALHWAYDKPALTYLHGWLLAFGPVLFVLLYRWRRSLTWLAEHQLLGFYLLAFTLLGYVGGTDTERLLYWSMPVVYVLLGRVLEGDAALWRSVPLVVILMVGQAFSARLFWPTPDEAGAAGRQLYPVLTLFGKGLVFSDLFSFFCPRAVQALWFAEFLALGAVILAWLRHREPPLKGSPPLKGALTTGRGQPSGEVSPGSTE